MNVNQSTESSKPLFWNISILRLILLSIGSYGFYETCWIYRNWRYLKERNGLNIRPFWRSVFNIFFCHTLLHRIYGDRNARLFKTPTFSHQLMATGWVALTICSQIVNSLPGDAARVVAGFIPSFLFLIPVQNYINAVEKERNPNLKSSGWSLDHTVCLVLVIWFWIQVLTMIINVIRQILLGFNAM
jgi:hypothetical protein